MTYTLKPGELNYIDIMKSDYSRTGLDPDKYTFEIVQGRGRYNKLVATYTLQNARCAAAFIDRTTGAMYKAASWSTPAKTRIA